MAESLEELVCSPDFFASSYIKGGQSDVLKALCLGARAVGLGRTFLYGQSVCYLFRGCGWPFFHYQDQVYGAAGVAKIVRILEREIMTGMRLLGASTIRDLTPDMVRDISVPITITKITSPLVRCSVSTGNL